MTVAEYKAGVISDISSKTLPGTILPTTVGGKLNELADLAQELVDTIQSEFTAETYTDMLTMCVGDTQKTIFVNQAYPLYNVDAGDFFVYYPTRGEAYLGIDFDYKN